MFVIYQRAQYYSPVPKWLPLRPARGGGEAGSCRGILWVKEHSFPCLGISLCNAGSGLGSVEEFSCRWNTHTHPHSQTRSAPALSLSHSAFPIAMSFPLPHPCHSPSTPASTATLRLEVGHSGSTGAGRKAPPMFQQHPTDCTTRAPFMTGVAYLMAVSAIKWKAHHHCPARIWAFKVHVQI